jgi:threonine/homoserine/homoserine lactone efflux protein
VQLGYIVDLSVLPPFLVAATLLCIAPGPDMVYLLATGVSDGRRAAVRAALGVTVGVFITVVAVAAGLGLLLSRASVVLWLIQLFGILYLAWLAGSTWREASAQFDTTAQPPHGWFRRGIIVNLTNPKVLLFLIAFLPHFLGNAQSSFAQLLLLGVLFQLIGLAVDLIVGLAAGAVRDRVLKRPRVRRWLTIGSGCVYAALAVVVALDLISRAASGGALS